VTTSEQVRGQEEVAAAAAEAEKVWREVEGEEVTEEPASDDASAITLAPQMPSEVGGKRAVRRFSSQDRPGHLVCFVRRFALQQEQAARAAAAGAGRSRAATTSSPGTTVLRVPGNSC
jgi:hypothetical protein